MAKATILIVDDIIENLQVLGSTLFDKGYEVAVAENAKSALKILDEIIPDLILLDIMMPGIDGFQLCQQIKNNDILKDIPIIFLTAKSDTDNIIEGFQYGAVDYITKPFNQNELLIRVKSHIELQLSKKRIAEYNIQLKKLLLEKDEFLGIAAHDMKNPINVILGFSNLIFNEINRLQLPDNDRRVISNYIEKIKQTSAFMSRTITAMLNNETLAKGVIPLDILKTNVGQLINSIIESLIPIANSKGIKIFSNNFADLYADVDEDRFHEIVENIISNAVKYTELNSRINICLAKRIEDDKTFLFFSVEDQGQGLNPEDIKNAFQKFKKLSTIPTGGESSTGIGLSIVKKLVELHNGTIRIESYKGKGAKFIVEFPLKKSYANDYNKYKEVKFSEVNLGNIVFKTSSIEKISSDIIDEINKVDIRLLDKDLFSILNIDLLKQWEVVKKSSVINDIRNFALELKKVGLEYDLSSIETYGNELNKITLTFDLENLPTMLDLYPEIIKAYERVINKRIED